MTFQAGGTGPSRDKCELTDGFGAQCSFFLEVRSDSYRIEMFLSMTSCSAISKFLYWRRLTDRGLRRILGIPTIRGRGTWRVFYHVRRTSHVREVEEVSQPSPPPSPWQSRQLSVGRTQLSSSEGRWSRTCGRVCSVSGEANARNMGILRGLRDIKSLSTKNVCKNRMNSGRAHLGSVLSTARWELERPRLPTQ